MLPLRVTHPQISYRMYPKICDLIFLMAFDLKLLSYFCQMLLLVISVSRKFRLFGQSHLIIELSC